MRFALLLLILASSLFARTWTTGSIAFWAVVVLCGYLLYFFVR